MMINTALYYPYIDPPVDWMKRSLLLFEAVSSIVPDDYDWHSPELAWLEREGCWRPTRARWLDDPTFHDDVETALLTFADHRRFKFDPALAPPTTPDRLALGKLNHQIEDSLLQLQLAQPGNPRYLQVHPEVGAVILAVTAKYLAVHDRAADSRLIPTTDLQLDADHAFSAEMQTPLAHRCLELALSGLLPVPGPDVSLRDVIDFRERHDLEVRSFRSALRLLLDEVAASDQPVEVIRRFREHIEDVAAALAAAARHRRLAVAGGTAAVLLSGAAATALLEPSTVHWVFDGLGTTIGIGLAERRARRTERRLDPGPFSYVYEAARAFGT
jgi:hypothetical protein